MKKVFNNKCGKKQLTLGEVKAMANKNDTPKKDEGTSVGATASISSTDEPHLAEINNIIEAMGDLDDEPHSTFYNYMADVEVDQTITMEKLQTRSHYWSSSHPKAMDSDKTCIICHKRNMNWPRYEKHLANVHELYQCRDAINFMDIEDVLYVKDLWNEEKPSPNPRYYDLSLIHI